MAPADNSGLLETVAAAPELRTPDETEAFLDSLPISELASMWCALQRVSRRDQIGSIWAIKLYFDHLPHRLPQAALDLVLEVLKTEADKPTVMQLNDKFLLALLYAHGPDVIARIEREAAHNDRLRWLLGGVHAGPDGPLMPRIARIADSEAWQADHLAHRTPREPLDCASMSVSELARAWVEQYSRSERDQDDNLFTIMDFERDLREDDPDRMIDLILGILKIESNPVLLALLAAGPLEDVISAGTIDRIEHEARSNERFRDLLGGVWYYRASDELKTRLDALIGESRW
ncbi:hypothetical protein A5906_27735 [Bradyrhizobium sacchari]|uniref:DUF6869 domain-containing protein n=1 Tax=Bradyrhizobium sacchari TaxID=1399419 RepID=A0A560JZ91_9BRAD|nr:hypothetical protein [Bradyrhizobium sacchari]OPY99492.1 hypothetical protein A5906_27735 [Bradyrhizobium sacchari]TWB62655.1 hypothetical protein FBZ94_103351 [Bradyrhizobium sacchari]TWB76415.1 hypothetical protein FBZ95_104599 [Bradyrhizobium sacchari]